MSTEATYFEISHFYAIVTAVSVVAVYILGLIFKMIYYKCYHPNLAKEELKGDSTEMSQPGQGPTKTTTHSEDEVDFAMFAGRNIDTEVTDRSGPSPPVPDTKRCNKRMRKLAENFYS